LRWVARIAAVWPAKFSSQSSPTVKAPPDHLPADRMFKVLWMM